MLLHTVLSIYINHYSKFKERQTLLTSLRFFNYSKKFNIIIIYMYVILCTLYSKIMTFIISDACYYWLLLSPLQLGDISEGSKTLLLKKMQLQHCS